MQRLPSCLPRQLRSSSQSSPSEHGSIPRITRDARYRWDTLKKMNKHCSCHFISTCFAFIRLHVFLFFFCPICWLSNLSISITALSFFCVFLLSISFDLLSYTLASLGCLIGLFAWVCVYIRAEASYHHSLWGLSLCLVLFSSIDFESKPRRLPLTHFSLWCHFAYSAVPQLNKMDSGMMWGGQRKLRKWVH